MALNMPSFPFVFWLWLTVIAFSMPPPSPSNSTVPSMPTACPGLRVGQDEFMLQAPTHPFGVADGWAEAVLEGTASMNVTDRTTSVPRRTDRNARVMVVSLVAASVVCG